MTVAAEVVAPRDAEEHRGDVARRVAVTESMLRRKANASSGVIVKDEWQQSATVDGPPSPGRMPTAKPMATPISSSPKSGPRKDLEEALDERLSHGGQLTQDERCASE